MDGKPLIASKTFWFNVALLGGVIANRYGLVIDPAAFEPFAVIAASLGNSALRWISHTQITGLFK